MTGRAVIRVALLVVAALLPASLLVAPAVSASTATQYANQAFKSTNDNRSARGLVRLTRDPCLQRYANAQAARMARRHLTLHQDLKPILKACGLGRVGENVASGYPNGRAVVRGWMSSAEHRTNILNRGYRLMAIAARKGTDDRWYVAQVFGRRL